MSHINEHTSCHIKLLILYPGTYLLKFIFISFYILIKEPNPQCLQTPHLPHPSQMRVGTPSCFPTLSSTGHPLPSLFGGVLYMSVL